MAIITAAEFCTFMGLDAAFATDAGVIQAVAQAQSQVMAYCERNFNYKRYYEWVNPDEYGEVILSQYPVSRVERVAVGSADLLQLQYLGACVYSQISIEPDYSDYQASAQVYADYIPTLIGFAEPSTTQAMRYDLTTYSTMALLIAAINADYSGIWRATLLQEEIPTALEPLTYGQRDNSTVNLRGATGYGEGRIVNAKAGIIRLNNVGQTYVQYYAGYDTMPDAIKNITLRLCSDIYATSSGSITPGLSSERLGDYSYQVASGSNGSVNAVSKYADELQIWRKMSI